VPKQGRAFAGSLERWRGGGGRRGPGCVPRTPAESEGGLHLADRVVDRDAGSLVEDLDAEDLGRCLGSVSVGTREGDVEGQDLVGVPGGCQFAQSTDFRQREVVDLIDGGADRGIDLRPAPDRSGYVAEGEWDVLADRFPKAHATALPEKCGVGVVPGGGVEPP